jgi:hypothetical protein
MTEVLKIRKRLATIAEQYLECLIEKDTEHVPVSSDCRITYNGDVTPLGDNELWHNTLVIQQRQTFLDPETGEVVFVGVTSNEVVERKQYFPIAEALDYYCFAITIRLKIENNLITEVEELAHRGRSRYFFCLPEDIKIPDLMFEMIVPEEERSTKEELIKVAESYWDGTFGNAPLSDMPVHPDCQRIENGYQTTNHSNSFRGDFKWNGALKGDTGMNVSVPKEYRYYPVVDVARGIVISYASMLVVAGTVHHNFRITEIFLVREGCIKRIMAVYPQINNEGGWKY